MQRNITSTNSAMSFVRCAMTLILIYTLLRRWGTL
jgi:hypothetical protein